MAGLDILERQQVVFALRPDLALDRRLKRVAWERWGPTFVGERGGGRLQVLAFIVKGRMRLETAGEAREQWAGAGELMVFGYGRLHRIGVDPSRPPEHFIVTYSEVNDFAHTRAVLGASPCVLRPNNPHEIETLFRYIHDLASAGGPFMEDICNSLLPVLLTAIQRGRIAQAGHVRPGQRKYFECKTWLERNFQNIYSAREVADKMGMSHVYLCRIFKEYGNTTPHTYLLRLKMSYAEHLLHVSEYSLAEIAEQMGFADAYSFSKAFKRITGISPHYYRSGAGGLRLSDPVNPSTPPGCV